MFILLQPYWSMITMLHMNFFVNTTETRTWYDIPMLKKWIVYVKFSWNFLSTRIFINKSMTFKSRSKLPIFHLVQDLDMAWFDLFYLINVPAAHAGYIWTDRNLLLRHNAQLFMKSSWGSFICIIINRHFCLSMCQQKMSTANQHIWWHRHRIKQLCSDYIVHCTWCNLRFLHNKTSFPGEAACMQLCTVLDLYGQKGMQ